MVKGVLPANIYFERMAGVQIMRETVEKEGSCSAASGPATVFADPLVASFPEIQRLATIRAGILFIDFADVPVP